MPLSDHEQRILADIEARLRADDPRFVDTVGSTTVLRHARRRLKFAGLGAVVGFALLFVGLQVHLVWGLLGFGLTLASVYQGLILAKRLAGTQPSRPRVAAGGALQRYLDAARRREDDQG
ncbi:MAG: DUF3040 domain-containing protein [Nitriliruptorales bacterium]|nr:DUF3040 domain-containing protein [Nitriliruptorales bacterium]